jgi:hypothetical protein
MEGVGEGEIILCLSLSWETFGFTATSAAVLLNFWTKKALPTFADFFPGVLSVYCITNIGGRNSEAEMGEAGGGAQRPVLRGYKPKKTGALIKKAHARHKTH